MINVFYREENGVLETKKNPVFAEMDYNKLRKSWIHLQNPSEEEIKSVLELTDIEEQMLRTTLDEEEMAHIDIDDDSILIVMDTPLTVINEEENNFYETNPFSILYNNDFFITVSKSKKNDFLDNFFNRRKKSICTNKKVRTAIQLLYSNETMFVQTLRLIDKDISGIEKQINVSLKNSQLLSLLNIEKALVYISTSLNSNGSVLQKTRRLEQFRKYEEDIDLIEDAIIESQQANEMCSIYRNILSSKMDAYASIINNNVNQTMKTLTILTIVFSIPTLISSFWGVNIINLPFAKMDNGFLILVVISAIITIISAIWLTKFANKDH